MQPALTARKAHETLYIMAIWHSYVGGYSNMGVQTLLGRELAFLLFTTFGVLLLLWSFYDLSKAGDKRGVIAIGFPMSILILAIMADAWLELGVLH